MDITKTTPAVWRRPRKVLLCGAVVVSLAGCEGANMPAFLQGGGTTTTEDGTVTSQRSTRLVERDVEAPEVFQVNEPGLWDGRPSLGGVWAAHPDVSEPERVIIRNEANGNFVIGALFRKERETPGPRLQISSDAAAALGVLAGAPTNLNVVALRREEVPDDAVSAPAQDAPVGEGTLDAPADVAETTLDPIAETAAAALEATPSEAPAAPAPRPTTSPLEKPYIQIGIFSVEENANNTATAMRQAGMVPTVLEQSSSGKTFWRVIVGPAQSSAERRTLLAKIKDQGFTDAYAVTN
ncbi:SPOR domain-containing protein [Marivita hallyeonensis]|uniref:Sporulation related domain-containing protein n=1 Tax=Marivita hallyeonensis TaxID=996342 RepID=A0A1M5W0V6_9RHOB|nr:SPOR domain-containing protein [Marivita hallyeonensis]SHH81135.1 Sporulation related domain-containing protein [Marivita hallyeonensis]